MNRYWGKGVIVFVLCLQNFSYSEKPAISINFEVRSENGQYIAVVKTTTPKPVSEEWREFHTMYVYRLDGEHRSFIWKTKFEYSGYSGGILSDFGDTFCYVDNRHNGDTHVVLVNKNTSDVFNVHSSKIISTRLIKLVSHNLQVHQGKFNDYHPPEKDKQMVIEMVTLDGKKHIIDNKSSMVKR